MFDSVRDLPKEEYVRKTRSSHREVFLGKGVLKICSKFKGGTPIPKCDLRDSEITLWHRCSPVNLLYIFRTPFLKNTSGWLLFKNLQFLCNAEKTRLFMFTWLPNWSFIVISLESNIRGRCKAYRTKLKNGPMTHDPCGQLLGANSKKRIIKDRGILLLKKVYVFTAIAYSCLEWNYTFPTRYIISILR